MGVAADTVSSVSNLVVNGQPVRLGTEKPFEISEDL